MHSLSLFSLGLLSATIAARSCKTLLISSHSSFHPNSSDQNKLNFVDTVGILTIFIEIQQFYLFYLSPTLSLLRMRTRSSFCRVFASTLTSSATTPRMCHGGIALRCRPWCSLGISNGPGRAGGPDQVRPAARFGPGL